MKKSITPLKRVELETGLTEKVQQRKLEQFYHETPLRDVFCLEVNDIPVGFETAKEHIKAQL